MTSGQSKIMRLCESLGIELKSDPNWDGPVQWLSFGEALGGWMIETKEHDLLWGANLKEAMEAVRLAATGSEVKNGQ
jgi:hypothetical protein